MRFEEAQQLSESSEHIENRKRDEELKHEKTRTAAFGFATGTALFNPGALVGIAVFTGGLADMIRTSQGDDLASSII